MTQPLLQAADLRAAARLTTDAVAGIASLVEAMHARIASPLRGAGLGPAWPDDARAGGVAGLVYKTVRGVTHLVGGSAQALLALLDPVLAAPEAGQAPRAEREAVVAALNGVLGDHLAATGNSLAIDMRFRRAGRPLLLERHALRASLPGATPRLLVLLHGLCMNDLQWQRAGHDHGEALARDLGYTPVYLHYNSGLSISTNGRILAQRMEALYDAWPGPIERLVMIGHSMGGLVARSAIHHGAMAQRGGLRWPGRVDDLVCLGSPHQGAPLERAGHGVDVLLSAAPYAAPLARLGKVRSAGIHDLRLGNIVNPPSGDDGEHRCPQVPLPGGTRCYAVAASLGPSSGSLKSRLLGDGLVPVASALGQHRDPDRRLAFAADRQALVHETGHLDLLSSRAVYARMRDWLA
ncbi:alpha/beta hydrolase [Ideonella sp. DXS22W]|uniref:Alpha/beta hydrolase n=1 Tax=Pseudaquabacterium inlustre TaxID=2984192 RepID=A0ABU9CDW4_9BURK